MRKRTHSIFRLFIIPLICVMAVQSIVTLGTLALRNVFYDLREYSVNTMKNTVSNRQMILKNDMIEHWGSIRAYEEALTEELVSFLEERGLSYEEFQNSEEEKQNFLTKLFPECLSMMKNSQTNGIFLVMTGDSVKETGEYPGFFVRDSNPDVSSINNSDLLFERGSQNLSKESGIPFDTLWTSNFHFQEEGQNEADKFFYEPWRAGRENPDVSVDKLGYWSRLFTLEGNKSDSHTMITYSMPLVYEEEVYGIIGVEISISYLLNYLPSKELSANDQAGYILAIRNEENVYTPVVGEGILYRGLASNGSILCESTAYEDLFKIVEDAKSGGATYAVGYDLSIYGNNVPYEDTEWVLMGLNTETELFGMSKQLYIWIGVAMIASFLFGVGAIYIVVRRLTRPISRLAGCIAEGKDGLEKYTYANVREVDTLYDALFRLFKRTEDDQKKLMDEKERYQVALHSTDAAFFSYDIKESTVDIVNSENTDGQYPCEEKDIGFFRPDSIYYEDRAALTELFEVMPERARQEFRLRLPGWEDFRWTELSGKRINDETGAPLQIIGSIQDIEEKKRQEAIEQEQKEIDDSSRLFTYQTGMERVREARSRHAEGTLLFIKVGQLYQIIEENGIIFTNMLMELLGSEVKAHCELQEKEERKNTVPFRFSGDVIGLWIPENEFEKAKRFAEELAGKLQNALGEEIFPLQISIGAAIANEKMETEEAVKRASQAQEVLAERGQSGSCFSWELTFEEERRQYKKLLGETVLQPEYRESSMLSLAFNLFERGRRFKAQMTLLLAKLGLAYNADSVSIIMIHEENLSGSLEYEWRRASGGEVENRVVPYDMEELSTFKGWVKQNDCPYISKEESQQEGLRKFTFIKAGEEAIVLPMWDEEIYVGNISISGEVEELAKQPELVRQLLEIRSVVRLELMLNRQ